MPVDDHHPLRRPVRSALDSLAASLAEDRETLEFVYEPRTSSRRGFLVRTSRRRQVTRRAYEQPGPAAALTPARGPNQTNLF